MVVRSARLNRLVFASGKDRANYGKADKAVAGNCNALIDGSGARLFTGCIANTFPLAQTNRLLQSKKAPSTKHDIRGFVLLSLDVGSRALMAHSLCRLEGRAIDQVLHSGLTTTQAGNRAIRQERRRLAWRHGINPKPAAKWRKPASKADVPTGPKEAKSTVRAVEYETVLVAFHRHTLLRLTTGSIRDNTITWPIAAPAPSTPRHLRLPKVKGGETLGASSRPT